MKREIYFRNFRDNVWPSPEALAPYFLSPNAPNEWGMSGNDDWGLGIYGLNGTENDARYARTGSGQKQQEWAHLEMWGNPELGVLLYYRRCGEGRGENCFSVGDLLRLNEWTRTLHGDLNPVGLYIPFRKAWPPVKEFMETDGELPKSITWIASHDLPVGTFPDP